MVAVGVMQMFYSFQNTIKKMFLLLNFSFINLIFMITRFVELHEKVEHMVFHYVSEWLFYSIVTLISSEVWRETSIRSLALILFIKSELPYRGFRVPRVIIVCIFRDR